MARHKLLFLGRQDEDTGYSQCVEIARKNNLELQAVSNVQDPQIYISKADYVFAGGYLVALEAFLAKKIVLASFSNPVKKDYWLMHPMASEIGFNGKIPSKYSNKAHVWAKEQTWDKLVNQYEELWKK